MSRPNRPPPSAPFVLQKKDETTISNGDASSQSSQNQNEDQPISQNKSSEDISANTSLVPSNEDIIQSAAPPPQVMGNFYDALPALAAQSLVSESEGESEVDIQDSSAAPEQIEPPSLTPEELVERLPKERLRELEDILLTNYASSVSHRTVARNAEYLLTRADGRAADLAEIWPYLKSEEFEEYREPNGMLSALLGKHFSIKCGIGRGTVVLCCEPCEDLNELDQIHTEAMKKLIGAAERRKMRVLAYGAQPVTEPKASLLNMIYHLHSLLRRIGTPFEAASVGARDRVCVPVAQDELVETVYLAQLLEPIVYQIFSNSPIAGGVDSYRASARQWRMDGCAQSSRSLRLLGVQAPETSLSFGRICMPTAPWTDLEDLIKAALLEPHLLKADDEGWLEPAQGSFIEFLNDEQQEYKSAWMEHLAFGLGSLAFLPKTGTVEWGGADQQLWSQTNVFSAFVLGVMERRSEILHFIRSFLPDEPYRIPFGLRQHEIVQRELERVKNPWPVFFEFREKALHLGLDQPQIFTGLLEGVITEAQIGLEKRGRGEEHYLNSLWPFLSEKESSVAHLRRSFHRQGLSVFLDQIQVNGQL